MGYSLRIPLGRGTLKIKSKSRLRYRERHGEVPSFRLLSTYFVWEQKASGSAPKSSRRTASRPSARYPINAGGLHRHRSHAATLEPIGQLVQIAGAGPEGAHWLRVPVRRNRRDMHPGADIDRCGIRMGWGEVSLGVAPLQFGHDASSRQSGEAEPRKEINFLTGIAAMTSPLSSAQQPMGHVF